MPAPGDPYQQLRDLTTEGWHVAIQGAPGGADGVVVTATRGLTHIRRVGMEVADIAADVVAATKHTVRAGRH